MTSRSVFFVAVHRELTPEDRAALDQTGIVIRAGVATATGPWEGRLEHLSPASSVLRVEADHEHDARLRVATALGADLDIDVRPARRQTTAPSPP